MMKTYFLKKQNWFGLKQKKSSLWRLTKNHFWEDTLFFCNIGKLLLMKSVCMSPPPSLSDQKKMKVFLSAVKNITLLLLSRLKLKTYLKQILPDALTSRKCFMVYLFSCYWYDSAQNAQHEGYDFPTQTLNKLSDYIHISILFRLF